MRGKIEPSVVPPHSPAPSACSAGAASFDRHRSPSANAVSNINYKRIFANCIESFFAFLQIYSSARVYLQQEGGRSIEGSDSLGMSDVDSAPLGMLGTSPYTSPEKEPRERGGLASDGTIPALR
jgi:hypothetical protein